MSHDEFVEKLKEKHGDSIKPLSKYVNAKTKIKFKCNECGHVWETTPDAILSSKYGCPKCAGNLPQTGKDIKKKFREVHGGKYDYSLIKDDVVYTAKTKVPIICKDHGVFEQTVTGHKGGKGCPICNESQGEKRVARILDEFGINYIREYRIDNTKYRYDFYLPDFGILIEFHGEQHYKPITHFGGKEELEKRIKYDEEKRLLAKTVGLELMEIPYYELKFLKQNLIKRLKGFYPYWYRDSDGIKVFKTLKEVYDYYNIPRDTLVSKVDEWLKTKNIIKLF